MNISVHWCKNVRLATTFKRNDNSLTIAIDVRGAVGNEESHTITLFGLPEEITNKFEVFRTENTHDYFGDET